jgi:DNA-binding FadR family transcriptional regulator
MAEIPRAGARESRHSAVVDRLGKDITSGELPAGLVLKSDELERRYGVSRSVMREGLRVLENMAMVSSRRNVGVMIRPAAHWNVYDPLVIRWRLDGGGRAAQLLSLTELRSAVEPLAAQLAAGRMDGGDGARLVRLAAALVAEARAGDLEAFLPLDIEFHALILKGSGNEMLAHLHDVIAEVLTGRTEHGLMPAHPTPEARDLHTEVADAIVRGDAAAARTAMQRIVDQAGEEMSGALGM